MGGAVAVKLSALGASVNDDESLFGIGLCADRLHLPLAFAGAVSGIDVYVERPEAKGAVIAGGVAQRFHFFSAVCADKAVVIFCESFLLHNVIFLLFWNAECAR